MKQSAFLFISDFFRQEATPASPFRMSKRWAAVIQTLYHLCRIPIKNAAGIAPALLSQKTADAAGTAFYSTICGNAATDHAQAWAGLYWREPDESAIAMVKGLCAGNIVIGYDLSPFCRKALSAAGIPWFNIAVHPVRFLDDLLFGWETNIPQAAAVLRERSQDFDAVEIAVAHLQARYAVNYRVPRYQFPERALILLPQELSDPPAVSESGTFARFSDHKSELRRLAARHSKVFLYKGGMTSAHWVDLPAEDTRFLANELGAVPLPDFTYRLDNLYMAMASPFAPTLAGLASNSLYEATFFGVPVHAFAPSRRNYGDKHSAPAGGADTGLVWAIDKSCFDFPFWQKLLGSFMDVAKTQKALPANAPPLNARMIFRNGGSDFDDSSSFSQCLRLARDRADLEKIERDNFFASIIECYKNQSSDTEALSLAPQEKAKNYAIFSTGCQRLAGPLLAAVQSLRKYSGNADAFYFTEAALMPAGKRALLEKHDIRMIDSAVDSSLKAPYAIGTSHAYLCLKAPEILRAMGYEYSVAIHADVLCLRPFDIQKIFCETTYISACNGWNFPAMVTRDRDPINMLAKTDLPWWDKNINPGIVFNNNAGLKDFGFWDKAMKLYSTVGPEFLPLNEESLYCLLFLLNPQLIRREPDLRLLLVHDGGYQRVMPHLVHFTTKVKPWHFTQAAVEFAEKKHKLWHVVAKDVLNEDDLQWFTESESTT